MAGAKTIRANTKAKQFLTPGPHAPTLFIYAFVSCWLLMSHGRVGADEFQLTREFLAQVLGVRRPTVTAVPGILQEAGLILYHRGRMTVLDRNGLEAASCECYEVVAKELDRLLGERREPADASPSHQVVEGATSPG